MKELNKLLTSGKTDIKGYNNSIVDVLLPKEILSPQIKIILKNSTPENLRNVLKINYSLKSYLIYIASNVESLIDTWVTIASRDNAFFKKKIKDISSDDLQKWICGSKNKTKRLQYVANRHKSIYKNIVSGTLGSKISVLKCISDDNLEWFLTNKRGKKNMETSEQFLNYLSTCLHLRNAITHEPLVIHKDFWIKIFNKSTNQRLNTKVGSLPVKLMVNNIFDEVSVILNKASYSNLKSRIINHLKNDLSSGKDEWNDFTSEIDLAHILKK